MAENPDPSIVTPVFVRSDARGSFVEAINRGPWESLTHGTLQAGAVMGQHYHETTVVFFYLDEGEAEVVLEDVRSGDRRRLTLAARQGVMLRPWIAHRIRARRDSRFLILKSRAFDPNAPDTHPHVVEDDA